jgi:hypothetical protein
LNCSLFCFGNFWDGAGLEFQSSQPQPLK